MKLYHGSNMEVLNPRIMQSDRRLDFGVGFYLTSSYEQAKRWAELTVKRRDEGNAIITEYEFEENKAENLEILSFESPTIEWLKYVSNNRNTDNFSDSVDIVIGPVANDRTMPVLRLYFSNIYSEEETLKRLLPQKLKDQYAFKSDEALSFLSFKEVIKL